ncbi:MAG: recombinase RecA [Spirochaetaceae bacterium]|jgi:recombination protein RecA|nr:recombinase RecA [Spirochaetaceae bacterium]
MNDKSPNTEKARVNLLSSNEDKERALEIARLQIEKQFGSGSIMKLGTLPNAAGIEVIPSGSILLDEALGIGGYPRGRIIEIYGPESSGKTTLALHAVAEAQKLGGIAAFIDAEHALDPVYAKNLGVNSDELWVSQPDTGEQGLEIAESLVRSGAVDVIVVDSVAALTPQAEIEGNMGDAHMGLQARLMSQALRKLTGIIGKSRSLLIFINQIRMKIGVMFGNPETTTGGNALKFYASVRLDVRKTDTIEKGDTDAVGNKIRVRVVKNKVAPPFRRAEMEIMFGKGISPIGSVLDCAAKYDIISKKGAWYAYGEERIGQGRDNAVAFLESNPGVARDVEIKLRKLLFPDRELPSSLLNPPAGQTPAGQTPAGLTPADQTPAGQTPAGQTPAGQTPADIASAGSPGDSAPADLTPEQPPAGQAPEDQPSAEGFAEPDGETSLPPDDAPGPGRKSRAKKGE